MRPRGGTVLFLGAGATRPFGLPLTAEILPAILSRLRRGTLFGTADGARRSAGQMRALLEALMPGLGRRNVAPPLITDLLSVVDHMIASGQALQPGIGPHEMDRLRAQLESGLAEVLAAPAARTRRDQALLGRFTGWAMHLADTEGLTVVSTNYDVVVDRGLYARLPGEVAREVDFGISWYPMGTGDRQPRPPRPRLQLLKLHGSLDWLRCPLCDHLYMEPARPVARGRRRRHRGRVAACACGYRPLRRLLVAPSMVRDVRDGHLLSIWRTALEALGSARRWIVIGYSMPPEDVAIRSMFIRALGSRRQPPEVVLVQRGADTRVTDRYRLLAPDLQLVAGGLQGLMKGVLSTRGGPRGPSTS